MRSRRRRAEDCRPWRVDVKPTASFTQPRPAMCSRGEGRRPGASEAGRRPKDRRDPLRARPHASCARREARRQRGCAPVAAVRGLGGARAREPHDQVAGRLRERARRASPVALRPAAVAHEATGTTSTEFADDERLACQEEGRTADAMRYRSAYAPRPLRSGDLHPRRGAARAAPRRCGKRASPTTSPRR